MEDFSLQVLVGGKILEEKNGAVKIPWGSEYVIRVKNRHRLPAALDLYVDNELVNKTEADHLTVFGNDYVDVPGFLGPKNHGKQFVFTKLSDRRVAQPGESDNGVVRARMYLQKEPEKLPASQTTIIHEYYPAYYPRPIWIYNPCIGSPWYPVVWCSNHAGASNSGGVSSACNASFQADSAIGAATGATIEGLDFTHALNKDIKFDMEQAPRELSLRLIGVRAIARKAGNRNHKFSRRKIRR